MKKEMQKKSTPKRVAKLQSAEKILENSFIHAGTVVNSLSQSFLIVDTKLTVICANKFFYTFFREKAINVEGTKLLQIMNALFSTPLLKKTLKIMLQEKRSFFKDLEMTNEFPKVGKKTIILSGKWIFMDIETTTPSHILLSVEDATGLINLADLIANEMKPKKK